MSITGIRGWLLLAADFLVFLPVVDARVLRTSNVPFLSFRPSILTKAQRIILNALARGQLKGRRGTGLAH